MLYNTYYAPKTLDEALTLLKAKSGRIMPIAGGTDLMIKLKNHVITVDALLDVNGITEMKEIHLVKNSLHIGAAVTFTEVIESELLRKHAPLIVEASQFIGAAQIQHMGTIGGNIGNASPAGDVLSCLYAMDAELSVVNIKGERTIPISHFIQDYRKIDLKQGELIKEVIFEPLPSGSGSAFVKFGLRRSQAVSVEMVAAILQLDETVIKHAAVALGSVAPTIVRCSSAEEVLVGQPPSEELFEKASEAARIDITPVDDIRSTSNFRQYIAKPLVREALQKAWNRTKLARKGGITV
jgi:CO/xanthine dehydrogenase FAD-binding subunit